MTTLQTPARNTRAILIEQQERTHRVELTLPLILRNPFLVLLWLLTLSTVVAALLLGRIRVPRTAHGLVVATPAASDPDSLTPVLLLPAWSRDFIHAGTVASVDTGGTHHLALTIANVEVAPLNLTSARRWLDTPNASPATIDTTMVVARLTTCSTAPCPKLATGTRYTAIAQLGTRSLASFAIPGT